MKRFDYSFLQHEQIPNNTLSLLVAIEKIKAEGKIYEMKYPDVFNNLQEIAIIQSVKASNAIEGIVTTDKRIKAILSESVAPINHDEEEIVGYRDVLNIIHNNYDDYQINKKDILEFHRLFISYTGFSYGGVYKDEDNIITHTDMFCRRSIRFVPTSAKETEDAMEQLMLAYMDARDTSNISRLLLIPSVILDFLCIHPFGDGNGRMSRLLSLLLLYKNEYNVGKYVSFENKININKDEYYEGLKLSSIDWHENSSNYFPFINNFLKTVLICYKELYERFEIINNQKDNKKTRVEETIMESRCPVSRQKIFEMWPDISNETIKKAIKELLKDGRIEKVGTYKDAKYKKVGK